MPTRTGRAEWSGDLASGQGAFGFGEGKNAYQGTYSSPSRFESGEGSNPEELIAAAHAGCFSMAFAAALTRADHPPTQIKTQARVHLDKTDAGWTITRIELETEAVVPGIDDATFQDVAQGAKENCPVSRALSSAEISLHAVRVGS
jgi:osmotically inducible protein OsmC